MTIGTRSTEKDVNVKSLEHVCTWKYLQ